MKYFGEYEQALAIVNGIPESKRSSLEQWFLDMGPMGYTGDGTVVSHKWASILLDKGRLLPPNYNPADPYHR